jgi:hypothetical protein
MGRPAGVAPPVRDVAVARVEPAGELWATRQILATALRSLGYRVDLRGAGDVWVLLLSEAVPRVHRPHRELVEGASE